MSNWYQDQVSSRVVEVATFSEFPPEFHEEIDQLRRRVNAKKIKADKIVKTYSCYHVTGSSGDVYETTLDSCTCVDYLGRNVPCKHIYRIALENGLINDLPEVSKKASKAFDELSDDHIAYFRKLYDQGAISTEKFLKIVDAITKGK